MRKDNNYQITEWIDHISMKAILPERFVLMGKKSMISHYMKLHYCLELFSKIQDHSFLMWIRQVN